MPMHLHAGERMLMLATLPVNVRRGSQSQCVLRYVAVPKQRTVSCHLGHAIGAHVRVFLLFRTFPATTALGGSATAARTQRMELSWIVHPRLA